MLHIQTINSELLNKREKARTRMFHSIHYFFFNLFVYIFTFHFSIVLILFCSSLIALGTNIGLFVLELGSRFKNRSTIGIRAPLSQNGHLTIYNIDSNKGIIYHSIYQHQNNNQTNQSTTLNTTSATLTSVLNRVGGRKLPKCPITRNDFSQEWLRCGVRLLVSPNAQLLCILWPIDRKYIIVTLYDNNNNNDDKERKEKQKETKNNDKKMNKFHVITHGSALDFAWSIPTTATTPPADLPSNTNPTTEKEKTTITLFYAVLKPGNLIPIPISSSSKSNKEQKFVLKESAPELIIEKVVQQNETWTRGHEEPSIPIEPIESTTKTTSKKTPLPYYSKKITTKHTVSSLHGGPLLGIIYDPDSLHRKALKKGDLKKEDYDKKGNKIFNQGNTLFNKMTKKVKRKRRTSINENNKGEESNRSGTGLQFIDFQTGEAVGNVLPEIQNMVWYYYDHVNGDHQGDTEEKEEKEELKKKKRNVKDGKRKKRKIQIATVAMSSGCSDLHVLHMYQNGTDSLKETSSWSLEYDFGRSLDMGGSGSVDVGSDVGIFHNSGAFSHVHMSTDLYITIEEEEEVEKNEKNGKMGSSTTWVICPSSNGDVHVLNCTTKKLTTVFWLIEKEEEEEEEETNCLENETRWRWRKGTGEGGDGGIGGGVYFLISIDMPKN